MTAISQADLERMVNAAGFESYAVLTPPQQLDPAPLEQMLADGVGDMQWLARHKALRLHPDQLLDGARSLLLVLLPYQADSPSPADLQQARYAAGKDYHKLLRRRLSQLGQTLIDETGEPDHSYRATVDSAPVSERQLAELAGLGWRGRNALILHPKRGSYHFIACLFTTVTLPEMHAGQSHDRCGTCTACEVACPTQALVDRRVLSTRCISYLTIEHEGVIPQALAVNMQGWWFGCDICQQVCPWNRFAKPAGDARLLGTSPADEDLLCMDEATFLKHFAGSPVRRLQYARFRRNLLVACWSLQQEANCQRILKQDPHLLILQQQAAELGLATDAATTESGACS